MHQPGLEEVESLKRDIDNTKRVVATLVTALYLELGVATTDRLIKQLAGDSNHPPQEKERE